MASNETRTSPWSSPLISNFPNQAQPSKRAATYRFQFNSTKRATIPNEAIARFLREHQISTNSPVFESYRLPPLGNDVSSVSSQTEQDKSLSLSREEIDAKLDRTEARLEATESRMEARLEAALSEIRLSNANLQQSIATLTTEIQTEFRTVPRTSSMVITAATSAIAVIGIVLAALAFGGDRFDGGVQISSASVEQAVEAKRIGEKNESQLETLNKAVLSLVSEVRSLAERSASPQK